MCVCVCACVCVCVRFQIAGYFFLSLHSEQARQAHRRTASPSRPPPLTHGSISLLWHAVYQRSRCVCASAATREWLTVAGLFTEVGGIKALWAVKMCFSSRPTRPPLIPHQRLFGTSCLIFDFAVSRMDGHVSTGEKYNIYCICHFYGFICIYIYIYIYMKWYIFIPFLWSSLIYILQAVEWMLTWAQEKNY